MRRPFKYFLYALFFVIFVLSLSSIYHDMSLNHLHKQILDNLYLKESNGERMQFGFVSKNGCVVRYNELGVSAIEAIEGRKDKRSIPILRIAFWEGDTKVRDTAYAALSKYAGVSTQELFGLNKYDRAKGAQFLEILIKYPYYEKEDIGKEALNRIIRDFPDHQYYVEEARSLMKEKYNK